MNGQMVRRQPGSPSRRGRLGDASAEVMGPVSMIRTQVSLTEDQMRRLRRTAADRGVSIAAVIREAVEQIVPEEDADRMARQRRAFALAGAFHSGHRDTSEHHDEVLGEQTRW